MGGALAARRVDASGDRLTATAVGDVEVVDGVLVITRIAVRYRLVAAPEHREAAERAHAAHSRHCPVYRSISPAIPITTELEIVAPA
ncbi:MAG: OsmC family protein [Actinomycetota bacterium]